MDNYDKAREILETWSKEDLISDILKGMREQEVKEFVEINGGGK